MFKGTRGKVVDVRPGPNGFRPPVCLAVSRNGSYLLTAAGGRVTLFNLVTSKVPTCTRWRVRFSTDTKLILLLHLHSNRD